MSEHILKFIADGQNDCAFHDGMLAAVDLLRELGEFDACYAILAQCERLTSERRAAIDAGQSVYKRVSADFERLPEVTA